MMDWPATAHLSVSGGLRSEIAELRRVVERLDAGQAAVAVRTVGGVPWDVAMYHYLLGQGRHPEDDDPPTTEQLARRARWDAKCETSDAAEAAAIAARGGPL
jgi:hypothetical protein